MCKQINCKVGIVTFRVDFYRAQRNQPKETSPHGLPGQHQQYP